MVSISRVSASAFGVCCPVAALKHACTTSRAGYAASTRARVQAHTTDVSEVRLRSQVVGPKHPRGAVAVFALTGGSNGSSKDEEFQASRMCRQRLTLAFIFVRTPHASAHISAPLPTMPCSTTRRTTGPPRLSLHTSTRPSHTAANSVTGCVMHPCFRCGC